ncbi:hypothetical protein CMV_017018 [Castanea mollissima]|uniref:Uncharacterized protein n=1 Tax=Castanea mollissima TaxID=60419 RepID=A0A8J4QYM1_9ROSI|nr:hypothetical protein CMV_017018 [Castanea mollissima]
MSPPSLGNGSKENEGCLQFHSDSYNVQNGRGSSSNSPFKGLVMTSECPPLWNGVYPNFIPNEGRKKICEGEDVSVVLETEILDLAEKQEKLQRSLGLKDFEVRNCSNFDKQATLQRRLEKFGVTSDEICVKEIQEMAEASLSIKTSCRVDDSFVSSGKSNINFMAIELNKSFK